MLGMSCILLFVASDTNKKKIRHSLGSFRFKMLDARPGMNLLYLREREERER